MSLLLSVLLRTACPTTHHKLAIDSLRFLRGDVADAWRDLLLSYHKPLLAGVQAPDLEFKDFRNHIYFPGNSSWGGAPEAARSWYDQLVAALAEKRWPEAAHAAGVLSHYVSDPFMPLNTRMSDAGSAVQFAIEWCVNRAYGQLQAVLEVDGGGYPAVEVPPGVDGVERLVQGGAELASRHAEALIQHFDLSRAILDPREGLDQELQDRLALCLGAAVVSFARLLELAIAQAGVTPPKHEPYSHGLLASLKAPFGLLADHTFDQIAQRQVEAMHDEFELTGQVSESLRDEQREIRRLYAEEVLRKDSIHSGDGGPASSGGHYGKGALHRFRPNHLRSGPGLIRLAKGTSPLADLALGQAMPSEQDQTPTILAFAPGIGRHSPIEDHPTMTPKVASRMRSAAVDTIGELLAADPRRLAERLRLRTGGEESIMTAQAIARLCCALPRLRPGEAQLLVAAGLRSPEEIARHSPQEIVAKLNAYASSNASRHGDAGYPVPDAKRVAAWTPGALGPKPACAA